MESKNSHSLPVKLLAIVGFSATILFFIWLIILVAQNAPAGFSSLASIISEKQHVQEEIISERENTEIASNTSEEVAKPETVPVQVAGEATSSPEVEIEIPTQVPQQDIYPVSNPSGYIDLATSVVEKNSLATVIDIVNNGTKVSETWSFFVYEEGELIYQSPTQVPLKPKEHALFGITVDLRSDIVAVVTTLNDNNLSNNTASN